MKFKIDENLPAEYVLYLREAGFEAHSVETVNLSGANHAVLFAHCQEEDRILLTLDLDFSNLQAYAPSFHHGIVVRRPARQDKQTLISLLKRLLPVFGSKSPHQQLWIVELDPIRIREK